MVDTCNTEMTSIAQGSSPPELSPSRWTGLEMAVLLPCYNEAATIADVIGLFQELLPEAHIFVYDNASTDETAARALEAGATIRHERERGKGNVVRRMFADIEADVYVLVDGDLTYDVTDVAELVNKLKNEAKVI